MSKTSVVITKIVPHLSSDGTGRKEAGPGLCTLVCRDATCAVLGYRTKRGTQHRAILINRTFPECLK